MDFHAELAAKLGTAPPVTMTTGEGSEFESSIAPSESVSAVGGEKHGKKKRRKKKKHKDKGLTEDDYEKSASKSKGIFMHMRMYIVNTESIQMASCHSFGN